MTISCIANGSKKVLLWAGASYIGLSAIALISTVVFTGGCKYKGIPYRGRQAKLYDPILLFPQTLLALTLPVLPFRKSIVCTILVAGGVLSGLVGIHRLEQEIRNENNELLSLLPTHSFMNRFCFFKTPDEAMEFHNINNKLLAAGHRKEAIAACSLYIKKSTKAPTSTEFRIQSGICRAQKIKNYSMLFSLSLLAGPYISLQSLRIVRGCDLANYKLMCELFGYQEVDRSILITLFNQYPCAEKLHSFWLRNLESIRGAPTFRQLRAREKGAFHQPSLEIDNSTLGLLLYIITIRQDKKLLCNLIGLGVRLQDINCLEILFKQQGVDVDKEYFRMLVENGAELFNDKGYSPINLLLLSIRFADIGDVEKSDVCKILQYLVENGADYETRYVPAYLIDRMSAWRPLPTTNTIDQN